MPFRIHPARRSVRALSALLLFAGSISAAAAFSEDWEQFGHPVDNTWGVSSSTTADSFPGPAGIAVDVVNGKVFVSDSSVNRVLRFDISGGVTDNPTAEMVFGQDDYVTGGDSSSIDGLYQAGGIALDAEGSLWVADEYNGRVVRYDNAATQSTPGPDADQAIYIPALPDQPWPVAVTVDDNSALYISDRRYCRVYRFDDPRALVSTDLSPLDESAADKIFGDTCGVSATQLDQPRGLAVDENGTLWVADTNNHRVVAFENAATNGDSTIDLVFGQSDSSSKTTATSATGMNKPIGIAIDHDGNLWVGDYNNNRVKRYSNAVAATSNNPSADLVLGQLSFTDASIIEETNIAGPMHLAYQCGSGLWVAEALNLRVNYFAGTETLADCPTDEAGPTDGEAEAEAVAFCSEQPDMAVSPQLIELAPGGRATVEVALRNLCSDRPQGINDLVVSFSDGLSVVEGSAGVNNLGQRAAVQGFTLNPGETRSWTVTVAAADLLPTAPIHISELYVTSRVVKRIDGVFVTPAAAAPAAPEAAAPAESAATPTVAVAPLPTALPNTGAADSIDTLLIALSSTLLGVLFFISGILLHRRPNQR